MMRRSVITDEVSQSIDEVAAFARRFSLDGLELRSVEGLGPFAYTEPLTRRLEALFASLGIPCCCLSLPFYKCSLRDMAARAEHLENLKRALEVADRLSCRLVRGFCFWRDPEDLNVPLEAIREAYQPVERLLQDANIVMALEADPSVYGSTAGELATILNMICSESIRAIWDGGNLLFVENGEDPIVGYEIMQPWIVHVHIKDAIRQPDGAKSVRVGTGEAHIAEQLALLARDGYEGFLSLETHYRLDTELDEAQLRLPGGDAFSRGGLAASTESMYELDTLLREVERA